MLLEGVFDPNPAGVEFEFEFESGCVDDDSREGKDGILLNELVYAEYLGLTMLRCKTHS